MDLHALFNANPGIKNTVEICVIFFKHNKNYRPTNFRNKSMVIRFSDLILIPSICFTFYHFQRFMQ